MIDIFTMRTELRDHLGLDEDEINDTSCDLLINRSYQELLSKLKLRIEEKSVTFLTVVGTRNYELPDDFDALRGASIENPDTLQHTPLDRITNDSYEGKYSESEDERDYPTEYVREGMCIRLWPTPDAEYEITIKYDKFLSDLSDDIQITSLPKNLDEIVLMGAVYRGHYKFGDIVRAKAIKQDVDNALRDAEKRVAESKEEKDSHRAHLEVILPEYNV